jgi:hypothetical protein
MINGCADDIALDFSINPLKVVSVKQKDYLISERNLRESRNTER